MGKLRQLSPELWPLIDVILFSYIFHGGVSCLPAALLLFLLSKPPGLFRELFGNPQHFQLGGAAHNIILLLYTYEYPLPKWCKWQFHPKHHSYFRKDFQMLLAVNKGEI